MAVRDHILKEVLLIEPFDETEKVHQSAVLEWIRSGSDLFRVKKPATPAKHLVSYFVLVDSDHVLLVDHRNAGLWLPTGGHVDPGEHPRETVIREAREELGISINLQIDSPLFITSTETVGRTAGHTDVSLWYVLQFDREEDLKFDKSEFKSAQWFPFASLPLDQCDPHLERFVAKISTI